MTSRRCERVENKLHDSQLIVIRVTDCFSVKRGPVMFVGQYKHSPTHQNPTLIRPDEILIQLLLLSKPPFFRRQTIIESGECCRILATDNTAAFRGKTSQTHLAWSLPSHIYSYCTRNSLNGHENCPEATTFKEAQIAFLLFLCL